jgi:LacI family transcriptional regulator
MSKKPTIQDIAKRAGVSPATVSRVLNDFDYVSEEKRAVVEKAMADLDYRPSFTARHMRTQRSRLIGFLTDEVATTPYAGDVIRGAEEAAWQREHILLVISAGQSQERAQAAVDAMLEREVEGIIYAAMYHRPVRLPVNIYEVPTVLANCFEENHRLAAVVPNEEHGGYDATRVLLEAGHRRIGFININRVTPKIPASGGRQQGYRKALQEFGVDYDESLIRYGDGTPNTGYDLTRELFQVEQPPTALFCGNDRTAMGAYDALRELGYRIPHDVAVMGFDNQEVIASAMHPGLSTMQLPHYAMGQWAVEYLIEHITSANAQIEVVHKLMDCPYVPRKSI